jgi:proteasome lid subunit RPN8/RPN11
MKKGKDRSAPVEPAKAAPAAGLPAPLSDELRIAVDKKAYAEIIGHAIVEPDIEVCGVLVGRLDEDAHGPVVRISAAIRGEAAKEQGAAVTFTHETWNHIHGEMDRRFKDEQIVGWYHTHGGFGVFLSEMDTFIHDNFFSEQHHVAYVYDPLAGSEAFFHRTKEGLAPVRRYWLGGRERKPAMRLPEAQVPQVATGPVSGGTEALERAARALESSATRRDSMGPLLPWAVALGAVLLLVLEWRGGASAVVRPSLDTPIVILDRNPLSGAAVGIPVESLEHVDGPVYRDRNGNVRLGLDLRGPDGTPVVQPGLLTRLAGPVRSEADLAMERQKVEAAERDRAGMLRILYWVGGALLAVLTLLGLAWYLLDRRR